MALEYNVLIDAIKLPGALCRHASPTSTSATHRYQVTWSAGRQQGAEGATLALAPTENEVLFHHEASFRTAPFPDRLLQLTVLQLHNTGAGTPRSTATTGDDRDRTVVGVLVIDLNAHIPKTGATQSKQRATLAVSLCPYDPPIMVRLAIESTKSHVPFDAALEDRKAATDTRRRSASRQRSLSQPHNHGSNETPRGVDQSGGVVVPPLLISPSTFTDHGDSNVSPAPTGAGWQRLGTAIPNEELLDDDTMELARLKAAVQTLSATNRQLRDDNTLLRNAVQKAREEPSYSYTVQRPGGSGNRPPNASAPTTARRSPSQPSGSDDVGPGASPPPRMPEMEANTILQAEVAVLQRGLHAAKEKLRQYEAVEQDLRAEIQSLSMTNAFQAEDIQRLEEDVRRLTSKEHRIADEEAELAAQKRSNAELQAKVRLLAAELQSEEHLRGKLNEEYKSLRRDHDYLVKRRQQADEEDALRRDAHKALVGQLEHRLAKAQEELEGLHKYAAEANERCHSIAHIVESQSKIIDSKNGKIRNFKALLEAQEVYKKMADRQQAAAAGKQTTQGGAPAAPSSKGHTHASPVASATPRR